MFKKHAATATVVTDTGQVDVFLSAGEFISRKTYQWKIGQRLENDAVTRRRYVRAAESGTLRCYLLFLNHKPIAFLRGFIIDDTYRYETPGFDPEYSRLSPGTALLLFALDDLMRNTACRVFDFGEGGDAVGYKKQFGNQCQNALTIDVAAPHRWYPRTLLIIQRIVNKTKNAVSGMRRVIMKNR